MWLHDVAVKAFLFFFFNALISHNNNEVDLNDGSESEKQQPPHSKLRPLPTRKQEKKHILTALHLNNG